MPTRSVRREFVALTAILAVAALRPAASRAATYYVSTNGSDASSGSSSAPFKTISKGVSAAAAGDTIVVNDGTYYTSGGSGSMAVSINKAGASGRPITLQAAHKGMAVLDCQLTCHSFIDFGSSAAYWVISGFEFKNGMWGGIWANSSGAHDITIQDNVFHHIGNRSDSSDNGMLGVYCGPGTSNFTINRNVFHDIGRTNAGNGLDHGVYTHNANSTITNNVFYHQLNGWHVQCAAGFSGTIANNTFYGPNPVSSKVGQMVLWSSISNVTIRNNIFYGAKSYAIHNSALSLSGSCTVDHNIVYTPGSSVSLFESAPSACTLAPNQMNVDPKLVNPSGYDFHLAAGSPAIDAGAAITSITTDFAGAPRPQGTGWDIGAYESGGAAPPVTGGGATGPTTTGPSTTGPSTTGPGTTGPATTGPVTIVPTPPPGCTASGTSWVNLPRPSESGAFTFEWDATPSAGAMDSVMGLSKGAASSYTSLAAIVRFNNAGRIDARNGGAYAAAATIPYTAGQAYHFRLVVDMASHKYSAYVRQGSSPEQMIGSNYAFRTEQALVTSLSNMGLLTTTGTQQICGITSSAVSPPTTGTSAPTAAKTTVLSGCLSAGAWQSVSIPPQTDGFTVEFDATPSGSAVDAVTGASKGAPASFSSLAAAVRFNNAGKIDMRNDGSYSAATAIPYVGGTTYHFRLVIDTAKHAYSAYVRQGSGAEQLIGSGYAFRTEQASVGSLDHVGLFSDTGTEKVCSVVWYLSQ